MRMQGYLDGIAVLEVVAHELDLIGVDVRRGQFNGDRQVDDGLAVGRRLPDVQHGIANL
jgi:hypothetical protein